jgi:O-antigen/teichoic acid export membrane protein
MFDKLKNIDNFTKNIILVFIGTSLINFINLLYQLFIAHSISPQDFASFNTLIAILMIVSTPLATLQIALAKYSAQFNCQNQPDKIRSLFSFFLKVALAAAAVTFFIFYFSSPYMMSKLKIPFTSSGYILAFLLASAWLAPVFMGLIQGLELFSWMVLIPLLAGALKLILTFVFLAMGWNVFGALVAFLISAAITIILSIFVLRKLIFFKKIKAGVDFNRIFVYFLPVAVSSLCFIILVSADMILVKLFFNSEDAGFYSLAQMLGKIFLFLPAAISVVLLPKASGLHAQNSDTTLTLKKSITYAFILCSVAVVGYNLFPGFVLNILFGKALPESITLGRFFSVSMTFFMLVSILTTYFLSIEDLRFIKYLLFFTLLQFLAIILFHASLIQVQLVVCINAALLFFIHLYLAIFKKPFQEKCRI